MVLIHNGNQKKFQKKLVLHPIWPLTYFGAYWALKISRVTKVNLFYQTDKHVAPNQRPLTKIDIFNRSVSQSNYKQEVGKCLNLKMMLLYPDWLLAMLLKSQKEYQHTWPYIWTSFSKVLLGFKNLRASSFWGCDLTIKWYFRTSVSLLVFSLAVNSTAWPLNRNGGQILFHLWL